MSESSLKSNNEVKSHEIIFLRLRLVKLETIETTDVIIGIEGIHVVSCSLVCCGFFRQQCHGRSIVDDNL